MNNAILEILRKERLRCAEMLPSLDPKTEDYHMVLQNLESLSWKISSMERPTCDPDLLPPPGNTTIEEPKVEEPKAEEPKVEEPAPEEPVVVDDKTDWAKYRTSLRERMADARIAGLDTKALLAKVGAPKFSSIPDEELPALAAALDEALKEKK